MKDKGRSKSENEKVEGRDAAFQDAVVLVREPFVIDRATAMQAIRYTKELLPGSFDQVAPTVRNVGKSLGIFIVAGIVALTNTACTSVLQQTHDRVTNSEATEGMKHGEIKVVKVSPLSAEERAKMVKEAMEINEAFRNQSGQVEEDNAE